MQNLYHSLCEAGLKENEARIYITVLGMGEANIAQISKGSGVNRSTVYLAIKSLKKRGLLFVIKKNKTLFYAEDPRKMLGDLEKKKEVLEKIMPNLLASFAFIDKKPEIKYFEGDEGIKELYEDVLKTPNQEVLTWYGTDHKYFFDEDYFYGYYIPQRKKKKIWSRSIYPENPEMRKIATKDLEELRQTRFISNEKFKVESAINLYSRKIGIVSYRDKIGVIIESQGIFNTLKSIFEVMWDGASR